MIFLLGEEQAVQIDNRQSGGALWIIGGKELTPYVDELRKQGIEFIFSAKGGKSTKHLPAWFAK